MKKLSAEQSVIALFALCSDVSKLHVHRADFIYLNPAQPENLQVMKYILGVNGIQSELHRSHYYSDNYRAKTPVLRVSISAFHHHADPEFKEQFELAYKSKHTRLNKAYFEPVHFFRLRSGMVKNALVREVVSNVK